MPDISSIAAGLESLRTATEIVKYLRRANADLEKAEIKLKLAELMEALAEVKLKLVDASEENMDLRSQLAMATARKDMRPLITLKNNTYVAKDEDVPGYGAGPWCSSCFDTKGELVSLHHELAAAMSAGDRSWASYKWECPSCKASVAAPQRAA